MKRIPMISCAEYDCFTSWRRYRLWHAGQRAKIKRRYRRRERRLGRASAHSILTQDVQAYLVWPFVRQDRSVQ